MNVTIRLDGNVPVMLAPADASADDLDFMHAWWQRSREVIRDNISTWRRLVWLLHGHPDGLIDAQGQMVCSMCGINFRDMPVEEIARLLHDTINLPAVSNSPTCADCGGHMEPHGQVWKCSDCGATT